MVPTRELKTYKMKKTHRIRIKATVIMIFGFGCTAFLFMPPCVHADRDAYLQEKYYVNQLNSRKRKGFLLGKKKKAGNDPAVLYRQQQIRTGSLFNSQAFLLIVIFSAWLAVLWFFRISSAEMFRCVCTQISEFTRFSVQRADETRRKREGCNMASRTKRKHSNNNQSSPRMKNSSSDKSISSSVMEIIDLETRIHEDGDACTYISSPSGVISAIFGSVTRARKKFTSLSKSKDFQEERPHIRKCQRDQSSLRLRASGKQISSKDEELGGGRSIKVSLPEFLDFIEEDECSDNGTAVAVAESQSPRRSTKRDKHAHQKQSHDEYHRKDSNGSSPQNLKASPLQKKSYCESDDRKHHRNHHHGSHHHHSSSNRHTEHRTSPR